jgi:hypothetical protein
MKGLSTSQIADLNRQSDGGIFFEAIAVTRDVTNETIDYFANYGRKFSFKGNIYEVCPMSFDGMNQTSNMEIPTNTVKIFNVGGVVNQYVYDNNIRIKRNPIVLQILHCDRLGRFSEFDREELQVLVLRGSPGAGVASIFASLGWKLGDRIPKQTIETSEYPGIRGDAVRSG